MAHFYILFLLSLLLFFNWRISKTCISPSGILCLVWLLFLTLHYFAANEFMYSFRSSVLFITFILSFNVGEFFSLYIYEKAHVNCKCKKYLIINEVEFDVLLKNIIKWGSVVSFIGSLLYFKLFISHFGGVSVFLDSDIRAALPDIYVPFYVRIIMLIGYPILVLSLINYIKNGMKILIACPVVSILIIGLTQSGRAGILMVLVLCFFAVILRFMYLYGVSSAYKYLMRKSFWLGLTGVLVFVLGYMIRNRSFDFTQGSSLDSFKSYLLGGISAFDSQLRNPEFDTLGYGRFSFSSLYDLLGIAKNELGVYTTYYPFTYAGEVTNIFTAFRPMMDDFGIFGTIIFMFFVGCIGGKEYAKSREGNLSSIAFLLMFYTYIFHFPLLPITVHTSILFSFILPSILLDILRYRFCFFTIKIR